MLWKYISFRRFLKGLAFPFSPPGSALSTLEMGHANVAEQLQSAARLWCSYTLSFDFRLQSG